MKGQWPVLLFAIVLVGCARFDPHPLSLTDATRRLEERSLADPALRTFVETNLHRVFDRWPAETWDLDMLTLAAFYFQPALRVARAEWTVARGGEITAAQRPNPTLNVTPGYNATTFAPSPWIPLGSFDLPIETAGKRKYRRSEAAQLSEAARYSLVDVAWHVRGRVQSSLIDISAAERKGAVAREQLAVQEQIVRDLEAQIQVGALAPVEATVSRIALQKTRADAAEYERAGVQARTRLAEAIGIPVEGLNGVRIHPMHEIANAPILTAVEARRAALLGRADVLQGLAQYAAAESALHLEIAKQYPDVHLSPGYEFDQGDSKWSVGLSLELPVLNQNQGPIAVARARREEMAARFDAVQTKAMAEIDQRVSECNLARGSSRMFAAITEEQTRRVRSVQAQVDAGAAERTELLNARLELVSAKLLALEAEVRLEQAVGALEESLQRPLAYLGSVDRSERDPIEVGKVQ